MAGPEPVWSPRADLQAQPLPRMQLLPMLPGPWHSTTQILQDFVSFRQLNWLIILNSLVPLPSYDTSRSRPSQILVHG